MPIKRAAYKAIRSDRKKRSKNLSTVTKIKTLAKKALSALTTNNKADMEKALRAFSSGLDKASQKGIIHQKTASRKKARMAAKVAAALKKA